VRRTSRPSRRWRDGLGPIVRLQVRRHDRRPGDLPARRLDDRGLGSNEGYRLAQTVHRMTRGPRAITLFNKDGIRQALAVGPPASQGDYGQLLLLSGAAEGPRPVRDGQLSEVQETTSPTTTSRAYKTNLDVHAIDYPLTYRYTRSPRCSGAGQTTRSRRTTVDGGGALRLWYHELPTCANGSTKGGCCPTSPR
jgi:hypothetical protein